MSSLYCTVLFKPLGVLLNPRWCTGLCDRHDINQACHWPDRQFVPCHLSSCYARLVSFWVAVKVKKKKLGSRPRHCLGLKIGLDHDAAWASAAVWIQDDDARAAPWYCVRERHGRMVSGLVFRLEAWPFAPIMAAWFRNPRRPACHGFDTGTCCMLFLLVTRRGVRRRRGIVISIYRGPMDQ